jgi:glycosyltransferase involved in cell wall biosynthesis
MRIAIVSTCALPVPPVAYGGTELVIAELAKTLTRLGHDVTVFATGDSRPCAELRWCFRSAVWPPNDVAELLHASRAWASIVGERPPFDVVHLHQAPSVAFTAVHLLPTVLTLHHDRIANLVDYYAAFPNVSYVAISRRQADLVPELDVRHVVHHGIEVDDYCAGDGQGGWLAFVGRFAPEKGVHLALDVSIASGVPLQLGGAPHEPNQEYFEREVKPRLARAGDLVHWKGEVKLPAKLAILGGAKATLFPIMWEEPFGLAMIESMLVGTPVIAFARGAAPEIVDDGVTGFVVRDFDEMVEKIRSIGAIDRNRCRNHARQRWASMRMAREYERVYEQTIRAHHAKVQNGGRA